MTARAAEAHRGALRHAGISRDRGHAAADHAGSDGARERAVAQRADERALVHRDSDQDPLYRPQQGEGPEWLSVGAHPLRLLLSRLMIIRIVLLSALVAIGWFVFLKRNRLPFHIVVVFAMLGAGGFAVIFPG